MGDQGGDILPTGFLHLSSYIFSGSRGNPKWPLNWKCQTSSCACFSYCCLKISNYHVRKPQVVWFLSHSPAVLLSLLPSFLLPLNHQYHCPPSVHMWSDFSCATKVLLGTQLKKLPHKRNPTRSQSFLVPGFAGFYFTRALSSTRTDTKRSPSLSQGSPAATALTGQQPVLLLGSTPHSELHSSSILQNEENPPPQCKVCRCFPFVCFSTGELRRHKTFNCTSRSKRWADLDFCSMLAILVNNTIGIP